MAVNLAKLGYRVIRRLGVLDAMVLLYLPSGSHRAHGVPPGYDIRLIEKGQLEERMAVDGLPDFADSSGELDSPDRSFLAVLHADKIVSFSWFAKQAIEGINNYSRAIHLGTSLGLPEGTAFSFNAWTSPDHRGKRLQAALKCWAIRNRVAGANSLASMVDWTNGASLKALGHVGFEPVGLIVRIGRGPFQISVIPSEATRLGFQVAAEEPGWKFAS